MIRVDPRPLLVSFQQWAARWRHSRLVIAATVFALALATRGVAACGVALIERDGVEYLAAAGKLARGDLRGGLKHYYPPAYPAAVAIVARVTGDLPADSVAGEPAGQIASALAGALLAAAVAMAAAFAFGARAGWIAGVIASVHPSSVEQSAKVTADPLFAALVLGAVAATVAAFAGSPSRALSRSEAPKLDGQTSRLRRTLRWLVPGPRALLGLAGALAAASYLARPEGILVLAAIAFAVVFMRRPGPGPSRLGAPFWVVLPGLVVGMGYAVAIKPHAVLTGRDAGSWKLTKKRELFLEAGGERAFPKGADGARHLDFTGAREVAGNALERALKIVGFVWSEGNFTLGLALFGAFYVAAPRRPPLGSPAPARTLGLVTSTSVVLLLTAYALIRADVRYGAILFALLLPYTGRAVLLLFDSSRAHRAGLALLLLLHMGAAVRPRLERKRPWRDAGEHCRSLEVDVVATTDPRVAFYAGSRLVDLALDRQSTAAVILEKARAGGAKVLVMGDTHPAEEALVDELKRTLGEPRVFEAEGTERVVVFSFS